MSGAELDQLLRHHAGIWRGLRANKDKSISVSTGFAALDELLPSGGWPLGALIRLQMACVGSGELKLLLPAMAQISQTGRWLVWLAPPHQPYAPGLLQAGLDLNRLLIVDHLQADDLPWAMEKLLRSGSCGMALAWSQNLAAHQWRRLQLAAEAGGALAVIFSTDRHLSKSTVQPSGYAALHIVLQATQDDLLLNIVKARGSLRQLSLRLTV